VKNEAILAGGEEVVRGRAGQQRFSAHDAPDAMETVHEVPA